MLQKKRGSNRAAVLWVKHQVLERGGSNHPLPSMCWVSKWMGNSCRRPLQVSHLSATNRKIGTWAPKLDSWRLEKSWLGQFLIFAATQQIVGSKQHETIDPACLQSVVQRFNYSYAMLLCIFFLTSWFSFPNLLSNIAISHSRFDITVILQVWNVPLNANESA